MLSNSKLNFEFKFLNNNCKKCRCNNKVSLRKKKCWRVQRSRKEGHQSLIPKSLSVRKTRLNQPSVFNLISLLIIRAILQILLKRMTKEKVRCEMMNRMRQLRPLSQPTAWANSDSIRQKVIRLLDKVDLIKAASKTSVTQWESACSKML